MEQILPGDLVRVAAGGPQLDGIVFDTPGDAKVVVAVVDPVRGPSFRTVARQAVSERSEDGPGDRALRLLVRRTPPPVAGAARGGERGARGRPGHTRATAHRATGK